MRALDLTTGPERIVAGTTAVVAKVGVDGKVAVYNNAGSAHVVLDVVGWYST